MFATNQSSRHLSWVWIEIVDFVVHMACLNIDIYKWGKLFPWWEINKFLNRTNDGWHKTHTYKSRHWLVCSHPNLVHTHTHIHLEGVSELPIILWSNGTNCTLPFSSKPNVLFLICFIQLPYWARGRKYFNQIKLIEYKFKSKREQFRLQPKVCRVQFGLVELIHFSLEIRRMSFNAKKKFDMDQKMGSNGNGYWQDLIVMVAYAKRSIWTIDESMNVNEFWTFLP